MKPRKNNRTRRLAEQPAVPEPETDVAATEPKLAPKRAEPQSLWSNSDWAVTDVGLESRIAINGRLIEYVVEKERLLQVEQGTDVSRWARQIAEKSWVSDPEPLVEALAQAISLHHPMQTVIDLAATADEARRVWSRTHR